MEVTEALEPAVARAPAPLREHAARQPSTGPGLRLPGEVAGRTWPSQRRRPGAVEDQFPIGRKRRRAAVPSLPRALLAGLLEAVQLVKAWRGLARVEGPSGRQPGNSFEERSEHRRKSAREPLLRPAGEAAQAVLEVRPLQAVCWAVRVWRERMEPRRLAAEVDWLVPCRLRRTPGRPRLEAWRRGAVQRRIYISRRKRKRF